MNKKKQPDQLTCDANRLRAAGFVALRKQYLAMVYALRHIRADLLDERPDVAVDMCERSLRRFEKP